MNNIREKLAQLKIEADAAITSANDELGLESVKSKFLGKQGQLTEILKGLKSLSSEDKPVIGQMANTIKTELLQSVFQTAEMLKRGVFDGLVADSKEDLTLPSKRQALGSKHPLTLMMEEITDIFDRLGYTVETGPELESEFNNFEALNIPEDHPARDMHDTFYLPGSRVLRTHTSPVQIRVMQSQTPPLKVIAPGKVYRCDADVSHSPVFHQIEGFYIDEHVRFSDLKGTIEFFLHALFGKDKPVRFRPSYFPFTEPSCEVDVACVLCEGKGCSVCKQTGWLEIMGAGMVHRNVFRAVGYDPDAVSGFAFGAGIDRVAMLKYKINDIRLLYENDLRFLSQF